MAAVVVLALLALLKFQKDAQAPLAPVAVSLSSLRGSTALSPAPAERPLDLKIEAPDLAPGKEYRLEVADAAGRPVWRGAASGSGGKLVASMSQTLSIGVYWVRLYGADSELLREFGISVR
jgi:hypothetical protein